MLQRVKEVQESDLRMDGALARNIQRVLPVTQADIDAAAALGKGWVVWKVVEVNDPIDNLRGGTQLVIKQNSITPGQNVRRVLIVSGPGGETVVIGPGPSPLLLPDAVANSLSYVKAFGGTEQRNIPQPYTQVNYVTNTAQTAVNTGIMIDFAKNYEFEVECRAVSGSWYFLQSRASSTGNITGIHGATSGNTITLVVGNVTVCTSAITRTAGNKLYVKATLNAGTATLYVKDETANTEDTQTGSYGTSQPNPTAAVYLLGNAGGQYVDVNSDIYMARIKENSTVVMDYVPARQVATAGFYDKASGTFKTAETPANLTADGNVEPTPDAPVDIVSNNGVLKYSRNKINVIADNVVVGKYISAQGVLSDNENNFIYTPYVPVKPNTTYTLSFSSPVFFSSVSEYSSAEDAGFVMRQTKSSISSSEPFDLTEFTFTTGATTNYVRWGSNMYKNQSLTIDDVLALNYMLAESATAVPYAPYVSVNGGIYTDGTVETINVHSRNLFDKNGTLLTGVYNYTNGSWISNVGFRTQDNIPAKPSVKYTVSVNNLQQGSNAFSLQAWDSNHQWLGAVAFDITGSGSRTVITGTTPANTAFLSVSFAIEFRDIDTLQLELGSTATTYVPYYDGGTATAEMLLKVGDYQDVQSILDGVVTRNVGVKVLDGTEDWRNISGYYNISKTDLGTDSTVLPAATTDIICTHYETISGVPDRTSVNVGGSYVNFRDDNISTLAGWKQWLADQYAAGTPVIVLYPLATPTTESVAGQTLQVQDGDNTLTITQASLSGLELEAEYQKVA